MNNRLDALTPPHSLEAEQSVLGSLMLDNSAVDRIGALQAKNFYREDHRALFGEIISCISKGQPADVVSIWDGLQARGGAFLEGLLPYLTSIAQNTPSAANIGRYADIVVDRALLRGLLHVTSKADEMARNPKGKSADQVLDAVQSMVSTLAERRSRAEPRMIADILLDYVEGATKRADGLDSAMPTGIAELDRMLNGGLRPEQLVVIAGRPSMGKTALASHVALNIAETRSVLLFSMEMSSLEIAGRALANRGSIHLSKVLGKIDESDEAAWNSVTHGCGQLQPMRFAIDDTPAITLLELRLKAKAWKRRHGLDVIVVDYIGLMTGGDGEERHEQIGSYSRG